MKNKKKEIKEVKNEENINNKTENVNKKKFNLFSKLSKKITSKFIFVIALIIVIILIVVVTKITHKKESVDFTYLNQILEKSSELTSAKLTMTGIEEYKDAGAMIINRADFVMIYTATIRAGVELKEVGVESNDITKEVNYYAKGKSF